MNQWRMRPPPTLQGALTCWAAAISSFGRVTKTVPDWATPNDVVKHFQASFPAELNSDDSLKTPRGWIAFANAFSLGIEEIRLNHPLSGPGVATSGIRSSVANDLAPEHFLDKLERSHVITVIGTANPSDFSHTVVVYGADKLRLCYMDPLADPTAPLLSQRPDGGSGRVGENWFCETYNDFATAPRYLLIWRD